MTDDVRVRVRVDDDTRQGLGSATDRIKGGLEKLAPIAAGVGAAIAAGFAVATAAAAVAQKAIAASIERSDVGNLIAAQLGNTDEAAKMGKLAGKVYADNFGDSLQSAGNAVRDVLRNKLVPPDAADGAVKAITEKILTIGQIAEADSSEVARAIHQMLVTGMAKSADEAADILTRGFQIGADSAGDLLDTFNEYGTQFRKLGIDGKQALGLLSQGLKGGARDADLVADALKEFSIRAVDGSKLSADGFKALGLDAAKTTAQIARGGKDASDGLRLVLDRLRDIKDPVQQAAAATALFGTQSEDLGKALYALDLDTAASDLGDVAGAADKASAALGQGLGPAIETLKRKAQQAFADLGDKLVPVVQEAIATYEEFAHKIGDAFKDSEVPEEILTALKDLAHDYLPALKEALGEISDKVSENHETFEKLGHVLAEYIIPAFGFLLISGLQFTVEAVSSVIDAFNILVGVGTTVRNFAIELALAFLSSFDMIVSTAAKAFGWIPGLGPKLDKAAEEVHAFVNRVNNELKNIRDEDVYVRTHFIGGQGQSRGGEFRTGGIKGAATGGPQGGLTMIGEEGRELLRLPQGASVYPHANAEQLVMQGMTGSGSGGGWIPIGSDGSALGDALMGVIRTAVAAQGGRAELIGVKLGR